ncbi:hypothetical protein FALCPG4_017977 [Fusarium falciforme]
MHPPEQRPDPHALLGAECLPNLSPLAPVVLVATLPILFCLALALALTPTVTGQSRRFTLIAKLRPDYIVAPFARNPVHERRDDSPSTSWSRYKRVHLCLIDVIHEAAMSILPLRPSIMHNDRLDHFPCPPPSSTRLLHKVHQALLYNINGMLFNGPAPGLDLINPIPTVQLRRPIPYYHGGLSQHLPAEPVLEHDRKHCSQQYYRAAVPM